MKQALPFRRPPYARLISGVCCAALALSLAACGTAVKSTAADAPAADYDAEYGYQAPALDAPVEEASRADGGAVLEQNRKLVKTVSMDLETTDFDGYLALVEAKIAELGGYAESFHVDRPNTELSAYSRKSANIVARIPSARLDDFVAAAQDGANLTSRDDSISDITLQYVDTESRVNALKEEQARLLELIAQADSVEAIIAIEARLSDVRYELESYSSQLKTYDNQVEYSTVNLYIRDVREYTPAENASFGQRVGRGFSENLKSTLGGLTDIAVWLLSSIPSFVALAFMAALAILLIKGLVKISTRNRAKKVSRQAPPSGPEAPPPAGTP